MLETDTCPAKITYRVLREASALLILLAVVNVLLAVASSGAVTQGLQTFDVLAVLAIAAVTFLRFTKASFRQPDYVLLLETTGYAIGVLSSTSQSTIENW